MLIRTAAFPGPTQAAPLHPPEREPTLLEEIDAYARQHRSFGSKICREAVGYGSLYTKMQEGLQPRPATAEKLRRYLRESRK